MIQPRLFGRVAAFALALPLALSAAAAHARPMTEMDLVTLKRIGAPTVSADGRYVAYQLRDTDYEKNRGTFDLYLIDLKAPGAAPVKVGSAPGKNEHDPAFGKDGYLYYLSDAGEGGSDQLWRVALNGGTPAQVSATGYDVSGFKLSPAGNKVAIFADRPVVCPDATCSTVRFADTREGSGRAYDQMFVRHWDSWIDSAKRSRIFAYDLVDGKLQGMGRSLMGDLVGDAPSKPYGGAEELAFSPDGGQLYFTLRIADRNEPTSTNLDIYRVAMAGESRLENLTAANKAMDVLPSPSPDGKWLAWAAMARPGYEADRQVLMLRDLVSGATRRLTDGWDRSVASIAWTADSKSLIVTADDTLDHPAFLVDAKTGAVRRLTGAGSVHDVMPLATGGFVHTLASAQTPDDLYIQFANGKTRRLTNVNGAATLDDVSISRFRFAGANGDPVWGMITKPKGAAGKLPIAFVIHGGPQGSFGDGWSYRWNPKVIASHGYAVVSVDFHGSTGYGQAFTDAINKDWGGKPFQDLQLGLAAAIDRDPQLDGDNACALGASYGGYMVNWIAGNWPDRFKCLVQHDGVFDARAMAYETDELWFDEWEHGGPYFAVPENYEKWNPVHHVTKWKTPMLVFTGEKDFRIPYTQGLASFTALQRRNIPSRLVVFPDENHWVLKPKNSVQWHREMFAWLDRWTDREQKQGHKQGHNQSQAQ